MSTKKLEVIDLKNILTNKGTQGRVTLDQSAIKEYAKDLQHARDAYVERETAKNKDFKFDEEVFLQEADPFPAVEVYRDAEGHIYLVDGFHRFSSKKESGFKKVLCDVREGTLRDAILRSTQVNQGHGVRRTQKDKRRAVDILLADKEWKEKSNNWIAEQAGVSEFLVRSLRPATDAAKPKTVRTRGGGTTKAAVKGTSKKAKAKAAKKAAAAGKGQTEGKSGDGEGDGGKSGIDDETLKALRGIERAIGGDEGTSFRAAVENGSLPLSKKDIKDMAALSPKAQKEIRLLVVEKRFSPRKAYDFLKNPLPDKVLADLELRSIAVGGPFVFERNGYRLTFEPVKK